jgi:Na+/H+ antiporter NhaA
VLGAAMFLIEIDGIKILYTGDYSREEDRHLKPAEVPDCEVDVLIVESTYGVQKHESRERREQLFTKYVADIVTRGGKCLMPVFALANAGVTFSNDIFAEATSNVTLGVAIGLIAGKVLGVYGVSMGMIKLKIANMPEGLTSRHLFGVGFLAAIGFTMSLFVTNLAFTGPTPELIAEHQLQAKLGIFMASLIAGLIGYFILKAVKPKTIITQNNA